MSLRVSSLLAALVVAGFASSMTPAAAQYGCGSYGYVHHCGTYCGGCNSGGGLFNALFAPATYSPDTPYIGPYWRRPYVGVRPYWRRPIIRSRIDGVYHWRQSIARPYVNVRRTWRSTTRDSRHRVVR